ncbi:MAG: hypothetical protein M3Q72_02115 [Actinomycetota bacterium]|nr:hypothetical protein [Actinomycetota bacterium]
MRRQRMLAVVAISALAFSACGDDDDTETTEGTGAGTEVTTSDTTMATDTTMGTGTSMATDTTMGTGTTMATDTTAAGFGSFCQAEIDVEKAVGSQDPAQIGPAFETLKQEAPEGVAEAVGTAIAEAEEFLASDGEPTPEFEAAYAEVVQFVSDNCGFAELDVLAKDYSFGGIGNEMEAGPAVVSFTNEGTELHEIVMLKKKDGVSLSFEEILAMPEKKARRQVEGAGGAFAMPGETGHTVVDLTAGDYLAICFIPVGTTPEKMSEMEGQEGPPEGQPHFTKGMKLEFTVS